MADLVTSQVLENNARNLVILFTNLSDGTGETAIKKVDAQSATYAGIAPGGGAGSVPGVHLSVWEIQYDIKNMGLSMLWDGDTPQQFYYVGGFESGNHRNTGGIYVPSGLAGATGSILFTTKGAMENSGYTVSLFMKKNV
jgi:hypothetical protein